MNDERIKVKLTGGDGNVFAIMGKVAKALRKYGRDEDASEYGSRVMDCGSYGEAMAITREYVDIR